MVCTDHSSRIFLLIYLICVNSIYFFLTLQSFFRTNNLSSKESHLLLETATINFPTTCCTLLATTDPLRSALETIRSPKIYPPRILLDSLSSQNKFQNFTHLESEKHLFPQSINDLQLHDKNFHRNLCILHRNTSQIKITTVKISKQIKLLKNIWWTQIPSSFKHTSLILRC